MQIFGSDTKLKLLLAILAYADIFCSFLASSKDFWRETEFPAMVIQKIMANRRWWTTVRPPLCIRTWTPSMIALIVRQQLEQKRWHCSIRKKECNAWFVTCWIKQVKSEFSYQRKSYVVVIGGGMQWEPSSGEKGHGSTVLTQVQSPRSVSKPIHQNSLLYFCRNEVYETLWDHRLTSTSFFTW